MSSEVVVLEKVTVDYGPYRALNDVNLTVHENDRLAVIGPNGGGKTTLLKVILGLIRPSSGKVTVFGQKPGRAASLVGYVPQARRFEMDFPISVLDVTLMGRVGRSSAIGRYSKEDIVCAERALDNVGILQKKRARIGELSGGQQQRVFIARALASGPRLLLLDEPTASVDPSMQKGFYELLDRLGDGMAVVLVSHDVGVVSTRLNKIACVNRSVLYHGAKDVTTEDLRTLYQCSVDIVSHGDPHRIIGSKGKQS